MKYYLTVERLDELKKELDYLKKEERQKIAELLHRAKEYGDLSENAEYIDAKETQSRLEEKIFELEETVRGAVVIKKNKGGDTIRIGSAIEVSKNGKVLRYTIVGSREAKPEENLISNESPLGRVFLGKKIGETVEVEAPGGKSKYKILKIE